jgi:hypothetical protein
MFDLKQLEEKLKDRNLKEISRRVDLSYYTLLKIKNGQLDDCLYTTVKTLSEYFAAQEG